MIEKTGPSPIPEDMALQQRSWVIERVSWIVMALFLVLGLLGVFYDGVLSETRAGSADGLLSVEYQRFAHRTARGHFSVHAAAPLSGDAVMRISPSFLDIYDIETIHPQPLRSAGGNDGLDLVFAPSPSGDLLVEIGARPKRFGVLRIEVAVQGRSASITQIVYP